MTYSNVRPETHHTREYLVLELHKLKDVERVWEDGSDIVVATFASGQRVMFYLVDLNISLHEIQKWLAHYQAKGFYMLFMFWADMMLPSQGERYIPDDWMQPILSLYGDKIYGYDVSGSEVFIFPVHFQHQPPYPDRHIQWGKTVRLQDLFTDTIHIESAHLRGQFRTAAFDRRTQSTSDQEPDPHTQTSSFASRISLQAYYAVLSLSIDASPETIRQAYRDLARQYHPDLNTTPEATAKMQEINQAYQQIMAQFEE